jgi:replicative DNA helicase
MVAPPVLAEHLWRVHYRGWAAPRVLSTAQVMTMLGRSVPQPPVDRRPRWRGSGAADPLPVDQWLLGGAARRPCTRCRERAALQHRIGEMLARVGEQVDGDSRSATPAPTTTASFAAIAVVSVRAVRSRTKSGWRSRRSGSGERTASTSSCRGATWRPPARHASRSCADCSTPTAGWSDGAAFDCRRRARGWRDVAELARSLGGWCSISEKQPRFRGVDGLRRAGKPAFVCHINHPTAFALPALGEARRLPEGGGGRSG